ncbi:GPP34 family phosphoprotein [Pedococcus soli]
MGELSVARVLWLLGQDEQLFRPRVGAMGVAVAAAALVDVVGSGAATWVDSSGQREVVCTGESPSDALIGRWAAALEESGGREPLRVIHAINAMGSHNWDAVGADLARQGMAEEVPRPVRRWMAPRRRPDLAVARRERARLLAVIGGRGAASAQEEGVLAVAWCAGVAEHVLSTNAFTDSGVIEPTRRFLADSALVPRLEPAVSYLVSMGPLLGMDGNPGWSGPGG